jgi:DnaJ-class molecular chaperone
MEEKKILMPVSLTAENSAKCLFMGEFKEVIHSVCPACLNKDDEIDEECYLCDGTGKFTQKVMISWPTIKSIYELAVNELGEEVK